MHRPVIHNISHCIFNAICIFQSTEWTGPVPSEKQPIHFCVFFCVLRICWFVWRDWKSKSMVYGRQWKCVDWFDRYIYNPRRKSRESGSTGCAVQVFRLFTFHTNVKCVLFLWPVQPSSTMQKLVFAVSKNVGDAQCGSNSNLQFVDLRPWIIQIVGANKTIFSFSKFYSFVPQVHGPRAGDRWMGRGERHEVLDCPQFVGQAFRRQRLHAHPQGAQRFWD